MKKNYFLAVLMVFAVYNTKAQLNYTFSAFNRNFVNVPSADTATLLVDGSGNDAHDDGYTLPLNIGFPFNYNSIIYSTISANTNGFASFKAFAPIPDKRYYDYFTPDLSEGPYSQNSTRPVLAPLWDDLDLFSPKGIVYKTTGSAPYRVFTLQWNNVYWDVSASNPSISFQLKLYETSNAIEFVYKQLSGAVGGTAEASIGISANNIGPENFLSLNNTSASPAVSSTVETFTLKIRPATGQVYKFTPANSTPITLASFTGIRKNNVIELSWTTMNEQNNRGFDIERSKNGISFEKIGFVSSRSSSGSSSIPLNYIYGDKSALYEDYFYRLKQVDIDLRSSFSNVILIKGSVITNFSITRLYPNPALSKMRVVFSSATNQKINITIADINGRIFYNKEEAVTQGVSYKILDVQQFAAGIYFLQIKPASNQTVEIIKFSKL